MKPEGPPGRAPSAYAELAALLEAARRRRARVVLGTAFGASFAAVLAIAAGGVALLGATHLPSGPVRHTLFALVGLSVVVGLAWAALSLARRASTPEVMARALGRAVPALRGELLSAVQLAEAGRGGGAEENGNPARAEPLFSPALIEAHALATARRARGVELESAFPDRPARLGGLAVGLAVAAHLGFIFLSPGAALTGWRRLLAAGPAVPVAEKEPITGDVELTYQYPAYMRRPPRTVPGTRGEVSAPLGTEVVLRTRADRKVEAAELVVEEVKTGISPEAPPPPEPKAAPDARSASPPPTAPEGHTGLAAGGLAASSSRAASDPGAAAPGRAARSFALSVGPDGRELEGRLAVEGPGRYFFRFRDGKRVLAEGPPLAIAVEADAFPEVRITSPEAELEVDGRAVVQVGWSASDDVGLGELSIVLSLPGGAERRTALRTFQGTRRESGVHALDLTPLRLAEGEELGYRLEVTDGDTISGPKRSASATRRVKIYSEAEHHRLAFLRVRALWEDLVKLLGDRLDLFEPPRPAGAGGAARGAPEKPPPWTAERLARGRALDARASELPRSLETAAAELRADRSAPPALATALANIASGLRPPALAVESERIALERLFQALGEAAGRPESALARELARSDDALDRELEKDILYLEALLDRQRAADLVRIAKDLAARRRELANLVERQRQAPSEEGRKELLAEVARMKARMAKLLAQMADLAKGLHDEHMNAEALEELARSRDALGGLDEVEKMLARGDLEGAARALDQLGSAMDQMMASLERTAGRPARQNAELMKDLLAFKRQLEELRGAQEKLAAETEAVQAEYRRRLAERLAELTATVERLRALAGEARRELGQAEKGVSRRSEDDFAQARDRLADLERALAARDLAAALESARRALPPSQRFARGLEEDAAMAEKYGPLAELDPKALRAAERHASAAVPPAARVKEELEALFPDPQGVLGPGASARLGEQAKRQKGLQEQLAALRQRLAELSRRAPVFPQGAGEALESGEGHMQEAAGSLARRDPVRGRGEQAQALDDLGRLQQGMQEMAQSAQRGPGQGGFPLPFGREPGGEEGEGSEPLATKVEIPGADASRAPEAFRKDLLEAMKQGAPEAYRGEVQRYYEELVK